MRNDMVIEFSLAVNASAVGLSRLCWAPKRTMRLCQGCSWSLREACLSAVAIFAIKTIVTEGVNKFGRKSKHLLGRDDWPPPEFYSCIPFIPPVSPPNTYYVRREMMWQMGSRNLRYVPDTVLWAEKLNDVCIMLRRAPSTPVTIQ